jgi:ABC-2 type transport system ATP-binding protein
MSTALQAEIEVSSRETLGESDLPLVRVEGLSKSFAVRRSWSELLRRPFSGGARTAVLKDVTLAVERGEFFGLLGANGAGKTTLFRMLAAQLLPDSGVAVVDGCDVVRDPAGVRARLTPVLADERSLNWRLTARQNLELYAALYSVPGGESAAIIDELLARVELQDTGTKMVGSFSSGMKQRLLIARALLARPRVLLLDEPTRSLDPISARRFREFLRTEIVGRQQCTVLLATHSADEAFELCDRVAILERGRLVAQGRVRELIQEVSDDRYHLDVRPSQLAGVAKAVGSDVAEPTPVTEAGAPGWVRIELRISNGKEGAAGTLAQLTRAGIDVAHFQRRDPTLADLIERIVERRRQVTRG